MRIVTLSFIFLIPLILAACGDSLEVSIRIVGSGRVYTDPPPGIDCNNFGDAGERLCQNSFAKDTLITFKLEEGDGWKLDNQAFAFLKDDLNPEFECRAARTNELTFRILLSAHNACLVEFVPEAPDAGTPGPNAGTPGPDAGTPGPDAGTPGPIARTPGPDAGTPGESGPIDPNERIANGLVGLWHFDGDVKDSSGNNNDGSMFNNATYGSGGVFGQSLHLDGQSAYVRIPDKPILNPTDAITVQAWYGGPAFRGAGNNALIDKGAASHDSPFYQYHLGITGKDYRPTLTGHEPGFHFSPGGTLRSFTANTAQLQPGIWHHLVFTYNGARAVFYINGTPVLSGNISGSLPGFGDPNFGTDLFIGTFANLHDTSDQFLPGSIDEVAIWNRALSESEVFQLFSRGLGN